MDPEHTLHFTTNLAIALSNKMYSSYSNQRLNSNVLRLTPPGFKHPIDVQFPPRCLPVCGRCKKNFKTREHCRGRDCHTDLPWCDTYVCVSLDKSCTDGNGKLLDGPFTAKVIPPVGFTFKEDELDPLTPICAPCKDKNYTRTYCRQNKNHRQLPWSTVYVVVSLDRNSMVSNLSTSSPTSNSRADTTNNSNNKNNNESSSPPDIIKMNLSYSSSSSHKNKRRKKNGDDESSSSKYDMGNQQHSSDPLDGQNITFETATTAESSIEQELQSGTSSTESQEQQHAEQDGIKGKNAKEESSAHPSTDDGNIENGEKDKSYQQQDADFFFSEIPHSRTFLATVSCNTNHLQWVDLDRMLESQVPIFRDNNMPFPQDAYSMNHIAARFHPPPYQGMPRSVPYFVNSMDNSGMMDDVRVGEHRGRMLPSSMGQYGMIPYMMGASTNSPYNNFGYGSQYYGVDGPHPHMMGNNPSMGHFDSMRGMNRMPHMHQNMRGGGPFPFETPSMHHNMDYGGNAGGNGYPSQEMFHHDGMHQQRRPSSSPMEYDARQSTMASSNSMPFNPMMGGNIHARDSSNMPSSMDRMNYPASAPTNAGRRRPDMAMTMDDAGDGRMRFMNHPDGGQSFMMRHADNDNMYYPGNSDMRMQMPMDATRDQFHEHGQTPTNRQPQARQHPINQGNHDGVKNE